MSIPSPKLDIAVAQINTQIGAISDNIGKMKALAKTAKDKDADLIVFPECAILGYPPRDLLMRRSVIDRQLEALSELAHLTEPDFAAVLGYIDYNEDKTGKPLRNSAAFCRDGEVETKIYKQLLPTYDVFEEERYFEPGNESRVIEYQGHRLGISICEDAWHRKEIMGRKLYKHDPISEQANEGANLFINIAASPYHFDKDDERLRRLATHAKINSTWLCYANHVGGQDELIFDGHSMLIGPDGQIRDQLARFDEDFGTFNPAEAPEDPVSPLSVPQTQSIFSAVRTGTADYFDKTGFDKAVVGLSGGIDSAVTAAVGADALGPENLLGVSMATRYTSHESKRDAREVADALGIEFEEHPIDELFDEFRDDIEPKLGISEGSVTLENVQARIRGLLLMAYSNAQGRLLLATGNKSELAVGYSTLYGDMCGALSPLGDCPKRVVYDIASWLNQNSTEQLIPENIIEKPPSAELRKDQTDQDDLPPYDTIDEILSGYIEEGLSIGEIASQKGLAEETVSDIVNRIQRNEFKRRQAAPALKVTEKAFGMGWRYPLSAKYSELGE
jgi:NAD+ synthetase